MLTAIDSGGQCGRGHREYGPSKVLVVEFNTPQLAIENDQRIIARIQELWKLGQPAPTAYRRVGNYSVFVFDAPDEQTAKQLIDQVKYEQVVQWLGENPNILKEAQKHYINTTLGVLVAVLKASGYALIGCLGMGGLFGGLLFTTGARNRRRDSLLRCGRDVATESRRTDSGNRSGSIIARAKLATDFQGEETKKRGDITVNRAINRLKKLRAADFSWEAPPSPVKTSISSSAIIALLLRHKRYSVPPKESNACF